jgi:glycosyltransferase involved in cell wall biosynthesis
MPLSSTSISVALCTHNGEKYLREQLVSILEQSVPVSEIVLSDDASSDDTVQLARSVIAGWGDAAPTLVVLQNQPALGVSANFQQAISACTGELIVLSDQDDVWRRDKLANMVPLFEQRPDLGLLHSDARLVAGDGTPFTHSLLESLEMRPAEIREIREGSSFQTFIRRNLVTGTTTVIRSTLVPLAVPFPGEWVHDEWLALIAAATSRTDLVHEKLVDYRQHGSNQIGARKLGLRDKLRQLREPRAERLTHLLARAQVLSTKVTQLADFASPQAHQLAMGKLRFEQARSVLPESRARRVAPILRLVRRGDYSRFTLGVQDIVRDLVQPCR